MTDTSRVAITYFSDLLCIWAYAAQARLDEVRHVFGDAIEIDLKFCSVFGDTERKIATQWRDRGGYEGFNAHVRDVAAGFDHIEVDPEIWLATRPLTSESAHLFVKAVAVVETQDAVAGCRRERGRSPCEEIAWRLRHAFFAQGRDIAARPVQCAVAEEMGVPLAPVEQAMRNGAAHAALASDHQDKDRFRIEGSPTILMNQGRQKIYGNVGYRVIEANIREHMRTPEAGEMSWC